MLSASAYSFRQKSRLAISLSWVAGYTNVTAFLMCGGIVVSHVTGNVTHFATAAGGVLLGGRHGPWREVGYFGFLVAAFFLGAAASAVLTEGARRRGAKSKYLLPVAAEAALLCAFAVGVNLHYHRRMSVGADVHFFWMSGCAALAMGLQNATITKVSGAVVRTTHLTGVTTDLGLEGVQYLWWVWDKIRARRPDRAGRVWRASSRHPSLLRIALLASIFGSFLLGAVLGTAAFIRWPTVSLVPPVAFLLWIIWVDYRKPIADVEELDLTADLGPGGYEAMNALLPPHLGVYRLTHHDARRSHHAPDFRAWADRLPRHWRVVILAVSPLTTFDGDAALDLAATVQKLRADGRDLILCGLRPAQYRALARGGLAGVLGFENICPDLELALARGMNRVAELTRGVGSS